MDEFSKDNTIKELVSLLNNEKSDEKEIVINENENKTERETAKPFSFGETQAKDKAAHKRELGKLSRQRKREELEKLKLNQCRGITILMTQPNGKILINKLSSEADYIEFITSVFDSYKLQRQITDYRILKGEWEL